MTRRTQAAAVVPKVRGAALRALARLEDDGMPLSDILYQCFKEQPLDTLRALAQYMPKESNVSLEQSGTVTHEHVNVQAAAERLAVALRDGAAGDTAGTVTH